MQGWSWQANGGAIAVAGSAAQILSCIFINCTAKEVGGSIWVSGFVFYPRPAAPASIEISQCTFSKTSAKQGGAIGMLMKTTGTINISTFLDCTSQEEGGAVHINNCVHASVTDCQFAGNVAHGAGGGMSIQNKAQVSISSCTFEANTAQGNLGGGAMFVSSAKITLSINTFLHNAAPAGGGGALRWEGEDVPNVVMTCEAGKMLSLMNGMSYCVPCDVSTSTCSTSSNATVAPLAEHGHWICHRAHPNPSPSDGGNYAQYGPCGRIVVHSC